MIKWLLFFFLFPKYYFGSQGNSASHLTHFSCSLYQTCTFSVGVFQVCPRKHHHSGRVCWGGGGEPLLCTRPVAGGNHHQLAGQPRTQSEPDGSSTVPLYWPVGQWGRRRRGQSQRRWRPSVGRSTPVLQPVGPSEWRRCPRDREPHAN